jgi:hypothetical protein
MAFARLPSPQCIGYIGYIGFIAPRQWPESNSGPFHPQ